MATDSVRRMVWSPAGVGPRILLACSCLMLLAACEGGASPTLADDPGPDRQIGMSEQSDGGVDNNGRDRLETVVAAARADLAGRLQLVDADAIQVIAAARVTWPNGAMGCPKPGYMYTQALVDGYQVILSDGETEYHYHASQKGEPAYCESPTPPVDGQLS